MTTVTFDTHLIIESLIKEGMKKEQAEAIVKGIQQGMQLDIGHLVTKEHFDTKLTQMATKEDVANVKYDLLKWILPFY